MVLPSTGEPAVTAQFWVAVALGVLLTSAYAQLFVVVVVTLPDVVVEPAGHVKPPVSEAAVTAELAAVEVA